MRWATPFPRTGCALTAPPHPIDTPPPRHARFGSTRPHASPSIRTVRPCQRSCARFAASSASPLHPASVDGRRRSVPLRPERLHNAKLIQQVAVVDVAAWHRSTDASAQLFAAKVIGGASAGRTTRRSRRVGCESRRSRSDRGLSALDQRSRRRRDLRSSPSGMNGWMRGRPSVPSVPRNATPGTPGASSRRRRPATATSRAASSKDGHEAPEP